MDKNDARIYFISENREDLEEEYEEILFKAKNFILNRVPSNKLFRSHIDKLRKTEIAYLTLGGDKIYNNSDGYCPVLEGESVKEVFNSFHANLSEIKSRIMKANSLSSIIDLMEYYLHLYSSYALKWRLNSFEDEKFIISKESDVMLLSESIRDFEKLGFSSFKNINELENYHPLKIEAKRLSLWFKLENNGG